MNPTKTPNINHCWASLIVEELIRNGVTYFCIAPGSRSSPLTTQVAQHKDARAFIHFDERALAFHALGYVAATKKPAAIITTSGTAAANLLPAIIETSKKKLPLIVLTADRPPELRHTGAHQTIDQVKLYGDYVRFFFDMPTPTKDMAPQFVLTTIDQALSRAQGELKGPVHINCMYREPLAPVATRDNIKTYLKPLKRWLSKKEPYTAAVKKRSRLEKRELTQIKQALSKIKNGLIAVGKLSTEAERKAVIKLAQKLGWPVFADVTSGLRLGSKEKGVITYFDQLLLSDRVKAKIKPDGVLHLGGRMTSKRFYQLIDSLRPRHYITVLDHPLRNDPLHTVSLRVHSSVQEFCEAVTPGISRRNTTRLLNDLAKANKKAEGIIQKSLKKQFTLNEFAAAQIISEHIPKSNALFLASSLPVREIDMFATGGYNNVTIGSNRGASGIDGTVASACGYATGAGKAVTLLIGDLALLYDLNALAMLKSLPKPMTIVALNNDGGGIFSFLPIARKGLSPSKFDKYFGTPHGVAFKQAAAMFDLDYEKPKTYAEFIHAYKTRLKARRSGIIEVKTSREDNVKLQKQIKKEIEKIGV